MRTFCNDAMVLPGGGCPRPRVHGVQAMAPIAAHGLSRTRTRGDLGLAEVPTERLSGLGKGRGLIRTRSPIGPAPDLGRLLRGAADAPPHSARDAGADAPQVKEVLLVATFERDYVRDADSSRALRGPGIAGANG
jgi:hypothetical protein